MSDGDNDKSSGFELDKIDFSQFSLPAEPVEEVPEKPEPIAQPVPEPDPLPGPVEHDIPTRSPRAQAETLPGTSLWRGKGIKIAAVALGLVTVIVILLFQLQGLSRKGVISIGGSDPVVQLNREIVVSFRKLHKSLMTLKGLSKFTSNLSKMNSAIEVIGITEVLLTDNNGKTDKFLAYAQAHEAALLHQGLDIFVDVGRYYRSRVSSSYKSATSDYLSTFKTVLRYRQRHHTAIVNGVEPQRSTYELLYQRYKKALKRHKATYFAYLKFLDGKVKRNKDLAGILPVGRLRDTFWLNSSLKELQGGMKDD